LSSSERRPNDYRRSTRRKPRGSGWSSSAVGSPTYLKAELKIQEAKWIQFQDQLLETGIAVKTKRDTLTQIKRQIQSQPQYLVLSKTMTDEALWDRIENFQAELPEELNRIQQLKGLLNPTYQNLLNRLATTQIEYDTLVPKRDHL